MHSFLFTPVQALKKTDFVQRVFFAKIVEDPEFWGKIIWSDKSKFSREGIVNYLNLHYWDLVNPYAKRIQNFQEKFSYNVFCLFMNNRFAYRVYEENLNSRGFLEIIENTATDFVENLSLNLTFNC